MISISSRCSVLPWHVRTASSVAAFGVGYSKLERSEVSEAALYGFPGTVLRFRGGQEFFTKW